MPKITVDGVPGLNGQYLLELTEGFTNGDLHTIKKISGVRAAEIGEAFEKRDNDLIVALTILAIRKTGRIIPDDALWDAKVGAITFEDTELERVAAEELNGLPPEIRPDGGGPTTANASSSGNGSSDDGDQQEVHPSPTGVPI